MYYKTRAQLTQADHRFIAETLAENEREQSVILQLTHDPSVVTDLLHEKRLFNKSRMVPPSFLAISPQLFFYILVYQALDNKRLADDDVVDYVAGICVEFRYAESFWQLSAAGD